MSSTADEAGEVMQAYPMNLDPEGNLIASAFGRKGSGKTTWNRRLYQSYPFAKLCIDVNGNADPGPESKRIYSIERKMPRLEQDKPAPDLHYVADPGSPSYRDDLDRAVGMAMYPTDQLSLVWCGEVGELTTGSRTGPHLRRLLMQSRHYHTSALFDGPRPMDIDPLVYGQSDYVAVFDLPNPDDRDKLAKTIGFPAQQFRAECDETFRRGEFWHLLWVSASKRLYRCPPLPA